MIDHSRYRREGFTWTWKRHEFIEVRRSCDEQCAPACSHDLVCEFGTFINAEANPLRECGIQPLMILTDDYLATLIRDGPQLAPCADDCVHSLFTRDGGIYIKLDHEAQQWIWRLYPGYWWDGAEDPAILVGLWPD